MTELTISTLPAAPLHVFEIWSNAASVAKRFKATCGFALPHMGHSGGSDALRLIRYEPTVWLVEGEPLTVRADAGKVRQALLNIVGNALKYTPGGGRVELSAGLDGAGRPFVAVVDTGIGMTEEEVVRARRPFERISQGGLEVTEGVGLGLAIARDVARGHGGEITLERSDLGGLRALIRLPG